MTEIQIRFRHLQCFIAIAETKSVVAASNALRLTQPALSKTLRELEESLGAKLFVRDKKGMLLTIAGERFLQHAAASVASIRQGITGIRDLQRESGIEIRIGVLPNVAPYLAPKAVARFKNEAPKSIVRVVTGDNAMLLDRLRLGELALVVGRLAQPDQMTGLQFEPLFDEAISAVVRRDHKLAKVRNFKLGMIADYPIILPYQGTIIRHEIDRYLLSQNIDTPSDITETTSAEFGFQYAIDGDAVWFLPAGYMKSPVAKKSLYELPIDRRAMRGPVGITIRADGKRNVPREKMIDAFRRVAASWE